MFINYAHRGACEYAGENTLASFYLGLACGANGIETDVWRTKDGKTVLFHDDSLLRVTGIDGSVKDFTYAELRQFTVKGKYVSDKIVLFEDFLEHFAWRDLEFAIELKDSDIEKDVTDLISRYGITEKTIVTSFNLLFLSNVKKIAPDQRIGCLVEDIEEETVGKVLSMGAYQICPPASCLGRETVSALKAKGLSVRAWGVRNTEQMEKCYYAGVDGMTVNFPDKLAALLGKSGIKITE